MTLFFSHTNNHTTPWRTIATSTSILLLLTSSLAQAQTLGKNGTTLAASKTLDICKKSDTEWVYSGEVSVWNSGSKDTQGFSINDHVQNRISGSTWIDRFWQTLGVGAVITAGTTQATATTFPYETSGLPLTGDIRNVADVTIINHSGSLGTAFGPSPKATYTGPIPPPICLNEGPGGCAYTRGYWGKKPGVIWPAPFTNRDATFYSSGTTYGAVINTPASGNAYYILGPQFIAAVLNKANVAPVPGGVQTILTLSENWFNTVTNTPATCSTRLSCAQQITWAGILDDYNNGIYPGGPPHCGDETP